MIVHFIGGPAHGRSEAIQNPQLTYRMVELNRMSIYKAFDVEDAPFPPAAIADWDEHEYKITRQTARYAIAEWQAPPVDVRFDVCARVDGFDEAANETLRRIFLEDRSRAKNGVRCLGAHITNGVEVQLQLMARVDGPEDATALQLAAEAVQQYIDAELPALKQYISQVAATT